MKHRNGYSISVNRNTYALIRAYAEQHRLSLRDVVTSMVVDAVINQELDAEERSQRAVAQAERAGC